MSPGRRVVVVADDLMVRSRIEAASPPTTEVTFLGDPAEVEAPSLVRPDLMLVGLAATRQAWPDYVRAARRRWSAAELPILGFGPHKDLDLRRKALEAGVDRVIANSTLVRSLPAILSGEGPPRDDDENEAGSGR